MVTMQISAIYHHYQIMPNLQLHQLRVAGVAQQICEFYCHSHQLTPEDEQGIVSASLLHDMGNIIKFDLAHFPQFSNPEGLQFWQKVQNQYFAKYGRDEHAAAVQIVRELNVSPRIIDLVDVVGFAQIKKVVENGDLAAKICEYADDRVSPFGVVSLDERLQDLEKRYGQKYPSPAEKQKRQCFARLAHQLETQIFACSSIASAIVPTDITNAIINTRLENLQKFEIITT
jgi:hypothetical protein